MNQVSAHSGFVGTSGVQQHSAGSIFPCVIGIKHTCVNGVVVGAKVFGIHPERQRPICEVPYDHNDQESFHAAHDIACRWCKVFLEHRHDLTVAAREISRILEGRSGGYIARQGGSS